MTAKTPDVTAILVTYNRADTLDATIRDIAEQTLEDFRLVICDDASTDDTGQVCRAWAAKDERITYVRRRQNVGMPANLNMALAETDSRFVAVLHDGNRYDRQALEFWHRALSDNSRVAFVFNQIAVMDGAGNTVSIFREPLSGLVKGTSLLRDEFFRRWSFDSPVFGVAMVRRQAVERYGLLDPQYGFYADVDLWMGLLHDWDAAYVDRPLVRVLPRELQPNLFHYEPWEVAQSIHELFKRHRAIEFANGPRLRRYYELGLHECFCRADDAKRLLLLYRIGDFGSIVAAAPHLRREAVSLLPLRRLLMSLRRARPLLLCRYDSRYSSDRTR